MKHFTSGIEPLESRIAPATLGADLKSVTFLDSHGDLATLSFFQALFTAQNVNQILHFDHGTVNGANTLHQQLQSIDLTVLGAAASGMNVSVTVGTGTVDVGAIKAAGIDLGAVNIGGDLGVIVAGNTTGLSSLTVNSLGKLGTATQAPGGSLDSTVTGGLGTLLVKTDITRASLLVNGQIGSFTLNGSLIGGATALSGSVCATGDIGAVLVGKNVVGGTGQGSGDIWARGKMAAGTTVEIDGSVIGGAGVFSGGVLSAGDMGALVVVGGLKGGAGANSGQVGTACALFSVNTGPLIGGGGSRSGSILSTGDMGSVQVASLKGGSGFESGSIASASRMGGKGGNIFVTSSITGGSGSQSGSILSAGPMGSVYVEGSIKTLLVAGGGSLIGGSGADSGEIGSGTSICGVYLGNIINGRIVSGGKIATIAATSIAGGNIMAAGDISDILVFGSGGITNSKVVAGGSINGINVHPKLGAGTNKLITSGITNSAFDAGADIGSISVSGDISGSLFVAGISLGTDFAGSLAHTGTFNDNSAAEFGFGGSGTQADVATVAGHIGLISVTCAIKNSTLIAGVTGANKDNHFGTSGDQFFFGGSIGFDDTSNAGITVDGGLSKVAMESEEIGSTATQAAIQNTSYIALGDDNNGIGSIQVTSSGDGIVSSLFNSNTDLGDIDVTAGVASVGIKASKFRAAGAIGNITTSVVTTFSAGSGAVNSGIASSIFTCRSEIGTIHVDGTVTGSRFLAGVDLGSDFAFGGAGLAVDQSRSGRSIGDVTVTGQFLGSDLIASLLPATGLTVYGKGNDQSMGGTLGLVALDTSYSAAKVNVKNPWTGRGETNAIEASSISHVTIGGTTLLANAATSADVDWNGNQKFEAGTDLAIRMFGVP